MVICKSLKDFILKERETISWLKIEEIKNKNPLGNKWAILLFSLSISSNELLIL